MNVLGFYAICCLMEPPSAQPLEKTLIFSGEQPGNGASCFSSSLDFTPFFRLLPIESVLRLRQSNCGLPENTSKNNPKLSFPTIVVFKARFFFFFAQQLLWWKQRTETPVSVLKTVGETTREYPWKKQRAERSSVICMCVWCKSDIRSVLNFWYFRIGGATLK